MSVPTTTLRVDWYANNPANFAPAICTVKPIGNMAYQYGRSGDFAADSPGQMTFTLDNSDFAYHSDRNWHDNPSFEVDTSGWATATGGFTVAATSLTQTADSPAGAGASCGQAILPATIDAGVNYAIPYRFRSGLTYSASVYLRSVSGSTAIQFGIGSNGTTADVATGAGTITTSWTRYTLTWTPTADRIDAVFFVRVTAAAAATVNIDACGVNPGGAANTYIEAPTRGQIVAGRPVHLYATYSATNYPLFFGVIQRITPNPGARTVMLTCYDMLWSLAQVDTVAPGSIIQRCARDFRIAVLEDYERGARNFVSNPSFETGTTGWSGVTQYADAAPGVGGSWCGQFTAAAAGFTSYSCYLIPVIYQTQVYRLSLYLKATASAAWTIQLGTDISTHYSSISVTPTATWTRYSVTYTMPATYSANATPLVIGLTNASGSSATIYIDAVMVTRGEGLTDYADIGTGRWPNSCGNGSFDAGALTGWYDGFGNLCTNGSFETATTGWTNVTRSNAVAAKFGSWSGLVATSVTASFALSGTFLAGQKYDLGLWAQSSGAVTYSVTLGSSGTPADETSASGVFAGNGTWAYETISWTPTANRTDAQITLAPSAGTYFDGVQVTRRDSATTSVPNYSDTGPGGGGSFVTSRGISTSVAKWGSSSQSVTVPATATAGRLYDFNHYGPVFVSGQQYTASVWLYCSGSMSYKVGIGANAASGSWDESFATGTATAATWTQVTVTWTPTANRSSANPFDVVLYVYQTDAVSRTFYVDGVRVIPGGTADAFELPQWILPVGPETTDSYPTSASLSGSALQNLQTMNSVTQSRHWIVPTMASPWYQYIVQDRSQQATPALAETLDPSTDPGAATGSVINIANLEFDWTAVYDTLPLQTGSGLIYYSQAPAVPRIAQTVNVSAFLTPGATTDAIGAFFLSRYASPRRRPPLTVRNRWPSQLQRMPNDYVLVNVPGWQVGALFACIERISTTVTPGQWDTTYQLEESNFPVT